MAEVGPISGPTRRLSHFVRDALRVVVQLVDARQLAAELDRRLRPRRGRERHSVAT
jgi:hypothetical protein